MVTFRRFAFNNVMRNKRTYAAYFLSSAFSVMIFFVYAVFISHPKLADAEFGHAKVAMTVAEYIIYIFSFFFVFYSVSAFLKTRKKEFGILMMHGLSKRQLNWLVFLENMIIGIGAIITGIVTGMIFANLFLLIGANVLRTEKLPFYWPWDALKLTVIAFIILFFVISLFTAVFIRSNRLIELLRGSAKPKQEPKASILLVLLAAVLLLTGYTVSFIVKGIQVAIAMLPVVLIVIVGTYFLFSQFIVFTIRALKKNRYVYWRKTNIIAISDLAYRMKDNARMYFMVAIVSTVTICALGTFSGFMEMIQASVKEGYPFALSYTSQQGNPDEAKHVELIEQALQQQGLDYTKLETRQIAIQTEQGTGRKMAVVPLSDFNQFSQSIGYEAEHLSDGELLYITDANSFNIEPNAVKEKNKATSLTLQESNITLRINKQIERNVYSLDFLSTLTYAVVPDDVFKQINGKQERAYIAFDVPKAKDTTAIGKSLDEQMEFSPNYRFSSSALILDVVKEVYSLIIFVGLFVSVLFFVATGSFLYFRLYSDLAEDKRHYQAISKIGLSMRELSRIATTQVAILFYAPFIVAVVHSSVAMYALHSFFNMSVLKSALIVIGGFFAAQTLFFLIIRYRYIAHLKEAIR